MVTTSGIQERLYKRADAELEKIVNDAFSLLSKQLNNILPGSYGTWAEVRFTVVGESIKYSYDVLTAKLAIGVIEKLQDKYREHVVNEFMEKVDTLHDQIDELRDEIQLD